MRTSALSLLTILCLMLAVAPAMADTLYDNGPYNGTTDAWTINFGFTVSDSAVPGCTGGNCTIEGFHGVFWLFPGDNLGSVDIDFGSTSFGSDLGHVGGATQRCPGLGYQPVWL